MKQRVSGLASAHDDLLPVRCQPLRCSALFTASWWSPLGLHKYSSELQSLRPLQITPHA